MSHHFTTHPVHENRAGGLKTTSCVTISGVSLRQVSRRTGFAPALLCDGSDNHLVVRQLPSRLRDN